MSGMRDRARGVLREASATAGMSFELDENGEMTIERDDGQELLIALNEPAEALDLLCPLQTLSAVSRETLFAWLLEQNLTDEIAGGAAFAYDKGADMLVLRRRIDLQSIDGPALLRIVENHLAAVDAGHEAMARLGHDEAGLDDAPRDEAEAPSKPGSIHFA